MSPGRIDRKTVREKRGRLVKHWSDGGLPLLATWLFCIVSLAPIDSHAVDRLDVSPGSDTAYLPYRAITLRGSDQGVGSKREASPARVLQAHIAGGPDGLLIQAYNPPLNIDNPAIFSMYTYPSWVIEDDPVRLVVGDWRLYEDAVIGSRVIVGGGYRHDSAWVFRLDPQTDRLDSLYLCRGSDATGDGVWDPEITVLLVDDYDYDGLHEAFLYVTSQRDAGPRELFCVEAETLRLQWSLPVASLVPSRWFFVCGDTARPAVVFCSYNLKNGVEDANFSDQYAYLTIVGGRGEIIYNRIIAVNHEGVSLIRAETDGEFYVSHEVVPQAPDSGPVVASPVYRISRISSSGEILRTTELSTPVTNMWLSMYPGRLDQALYVHLRNQQLNVFGAGFSLLAKAPRTQIGDFLGAVRLVGRSDSVLVFTDGIYSREMERLASFPLHANYFESLVRDTAGNTTTMVLATPNAFRIIALERTSFLHLARLFVIRQRDYIMAALLVLVLALVVVNAYRHRAGFRLRQSESRFREALTHSRDIMYRLNLGTRTYDYMSASVQTITGYSPEDAIRLGVDGVRKLVHPDDFARLANHREGLIRSHGNGRGASVTEYRVMCKDGGYRWLSDSHAVVVDERQRPRFIIGTVRDITLDKEREAALLASEERFRDMADLLPESVFETDLRGRFTYVNSTALLRFGFGPQDVRSDVLVSDMLVPEDRLRVAENIRRLLSGDETQSSREYTGRRSDGTTFPITTHTARIVRDGQVVGLRGIAVDISDRKEAELKLRESEEQYRLLVENVHAAICLIDYDGRFLFANGTAAQARNLTPAELVGKSQKDVFLPEIAERQLAGIRRVMDTGVEETGESAVFEVDGRWRWFLTKLHPYPGVGGITTAVLMIAHDITDRVLAEEALRVSEETARALINGTTESMILIDANGIVLTLNEAAAKRLGKSVDELTGIDGRQMAFASWPEDTARKREAQGREVLLTGKPVRMEDERDGITFDTNMYPVFGADGKVTRIAVFARDITAYTKAIKALRESEQFNRVVIENSPLGVSVRSRTGQLLSCNPAWKRIWQIRDEDLDDYLHRPRTELKFDYRDNYLGPWLPEVERIYREGGSLHIPEIDLTRSLRAAPRWLSQYFYAIMDSRGQVDRVVIMTEDITERKAAEARVLAADREKYEQAKQIAGGFAHEIRNALFPAESALMRLIPNEFLPRAEERQWVDYCQRAANAVSRAIDVTELISMYTKLDSERMPERVDVVAVAHEVVESNRLRCDEQGVEVTITSPASALVLANAQQLYISLNNLVLNSLDALDDRPGRRIDIRIEPEPGWFAISVYDNGQGIAEADLPRVFEAFFSSKPNRGMGLGLATVRKIIELYDGNIRVASRQGEWTRFDMRLKSVNAHETGVDHV
jgi:PAS domain S-box-containing protein